MRAIDEVAKSISARQEDKLIAYAPAALPVFALKVEVLITARRELGAAERAVMQAVDAGLQLVDEVAGFLGVTDQYFRHLLASLEQQGMTVEVGDPPKILLRDRGKQAIDKGLTEERIEELRIHFDPILKRVTVIRPPPLHLSELGPVNFFGEKLVAEPVENDIDPLAIEQALGDAGLRRELGGQRILRMTSILETKIRFRPVIAMMFRNPVSNRPVVNFAENGQLLSAIQGKLTDQNDSLIRETFALCNSEEEKTEFEALVSTILSPDVIKLHAIKSRAIMNEKIRRSSLLKVFEAEPSEANRLAVERIDAAIETEYAALEGMDGFVQSDFATQRRIVEILRDAESHILLTIPGEPAEFPQEYLQLLIAATARHVTVTVAYFPRKKQPGNSSKNFISGLSKDAKVIHWNEINVRVPVLAIAWDGTGVLVVSHPPFAIDGRPERLTPRYSSVVREKGCLKLFFGRFSDELLAWALGRRKSKARGRPYAQRKSQSNDWNTRGMGARRAKPGKKADVKNMKRAKS